jgi:MFS family permease
MKTYRNINTFRAFRNSNYALFFGGQSISQIGTWMQRTAVSWVIYSLTHSTFMLGLAIFASQFPSFLFSLLGGIISDRYSRYRILLITQSASMLQAILMAILVLVNHYEVWEILSLSILLGIINAFDVPARQPLVHELVSDKADLPNALALNSSMVNLARLIGPALSGLVLEKFGAGACFILNAFSFVAVIISLSLLKLPQYGVFRKKKIKTELKEGFAYLRQTPSIKITILMLTMVSLLVLPYDTLLPVFAKVIFSGSAVTFGYIYSFIGLGAITGTFFLASLKPGADLKLVLLINTILLGIGLLAFSHVRYFPLAMVFAVLSGFGAMSQGTISITIIQTNADPAMRGRIISYLAMAMFGMLPLGSLLIGVVSEHIGVSNAMFAQGLLAIGIALLFSKFLRKDSLDRREKSVFEESENLLIEKV